ncbi:MAG: response regulator [Verrucomicrobiota bacterium]
MSRVLVVEDEPSILESVVYALGSEGIETLSAHTLGEARGLISAENCDLVVLDIGLPDGNGFDFCREIRAAFEVPIIFLTARSSEVDRVVGLEVGGGDYLTKPFSTRELVVRVRNLLRMRIEHQRIQRPVTPRTQSGFSGLSVDVESATVVLHGADVEVSASELRLLAVLVEGSGRVFSRDQLMELAWDDPGASLDRTVDSHVKNLRAKFRAVDPSTEVIRTHRGLGYSIGKDLVSNLR